MPVVMYLLTRLMCQMNGKLLRQRQGIPQGSKVSSLLCSFFYAAMEREHLGFLAHGGPGTVSLYFGHSGSGRNAWSSQPQ
jgi:hypothetical protein